MDRDGAPGRRQDGPPADRPWNSPVQRRIQWALANPGRVYRLVVSLGAGAFVATSLFPVYWLLVLAVTPADAPVHLVPDRLSLGGFRFAFAFVPLGRFVVNSVVVALGTTAVVVAFGTLAGYVFGRLAFPGRRPLFLVTLGVALFPPASFFVPLFELFNGNVGLFGLASPVRFDTLGAVVTPLSMLNLPLAILLLSVFFREIPDDLEAAARVEGATRLGAFWRVVLPLAGPGIATVALLTFIRAYNEYFFSRLMTRGQAEGWAPIVHGLQQLPGTAQNAVAAASLVALLPVVTFVLLADRKVVEGLTAGIR